MSVLKTIQDGAADQLRANPHFSDIQVITENIKDIENEIAIAVSSIGTCVVLITPIANCSAPNVRGPYFEFIAIVARVIENPTINRSSTGTNKDALTTAEKIATILHHFRPVGVNEVIVADNPTIVLGNDPTNLSYDVLFKTQGGISEPLPKIMTPAHSVDVDGNIVLSCGTDGAAIFYTTNGTTYPAPRVGTVYSIPLTLTAGTVVRMRAWLAGYESSDEVRFVV